MGILSLRRLAGTFGQFRRITLHLPRKSLGAAHRRAGPRLPWWALRTPGHRRRFRTSGTLSPVPRSSRTRRGRGPDWRCNHGGRPQKSTGRSNRQNRSDRSVRGEAFHISCNDQPLPRRNAFFAQGVGREAPGRQKDARNARSHAARRADPERVHGRAAQPREATVPKMDSPDAWCKSGLRSGEMRKLAGIAHGFAQSYMRCRIARNRARASLISWREFASPRLLVCAVFAQSLARFAHKFAWMNSP